MPGGTQDATSHCAGRTKDPHCSAETGDDTASIRTLCTHQGCTQHTYILTCLLLSLYFIPASRFVVFVSSSYRFLHLTFFSVCFCLCGGLQRCCFDNTKCIWPVKICLSYTKSFFWRFALTLCKVQGLSSIGLIFLTLFNKWQQCCGLALSVMHQFAIVASAIIFTLAVLLALAQCPVVKVVMCSRGGSASEVETHKNIYISSSQHIFRQHSKVDL